MNPGFYTATELTNEQYHRSPGISNSGLKLLGDKTPAHYWARYLDPARRPQPPRQGMIIGTAIHAAALEPERFAEDYAEPLVMPAGALTTSDDIKQALQALGQKTSGAKPELIRRLLDADPEAIIADQIKQQHAAANAGRVILSAEDYANVRGMHAALYGHPVAASLLADAFAFEYSLYTHDPVTGVLVRIRMDLMTGGGWIVDLKKTQDASPEAVGATIARYGYHHQAGLYSDALLWECGEAPAGFAFVFIEEEPPHAVGVYVLDTADLDRGRRLYRRNLDTYARCLEQNHWPAYSQSAEIVTLPAWERRRIDEMSIPL